MRRIFWTTFALLAVLAAPASAQTTPALLDSVQHRAFQYFWSEANPSNGMVRDRSTSGSPCSIAAVGFGLSAITVGIDHGWITRDAGRDRVLTTLNTFWTYPQGSGTSGTIGYHGLFYHFLDMNTGLRTGTSELSPIDTALLLGGVLHVREYFTGTDPLETQVRALADSIYRRTDWTFVHHTLNGIDIAWSPETGYQSGTWIGYNEMMIMYLEALGSPTHTIPASDWGYYCSGYQWQTLYGQTYVAYAPLFVYQYSHCWVDFRKRQDDYMQSKGIDYFENSRRATYADRAYCIANPSHFAGYSDSLWGLTASDDPQGYKAHGAPGPAQYDNGTISPTAATSSIPFAPEIAIPAIRHMRNAYPSLWGTYGFKDAFNLQQNWYDTDFLGIDQGPIVLMIENYLNGSVWARSMRSPYLQAGLAKAGFVYTNDVPNEVVAAGVALANRPNPFRDATEIHFRLAQSGHVRLAVYDVHGRQVAQLVNGFQSAGDHAAVLEGRGLPSGVYYYRLDSPRGSDVRRCVLLR